MMQLGQFHSSEKAVEAAPLQMQKLSKGKILSAVIATVLLIQLVLGLYALCRRERSYELQPDRYLKVEAKDGIYHLHSKTHIDIKSRKAYLRRKEPYLGIKPHFVARRDILGRNVTGIEEFIDVNEEDVDLNLHCNTCSIVGTAGTLLNSHNGNSIDKADCVFRLGLSPISGFEASVGRKTTARIISSKKLAELLKKPDKLISGHISVNRWIYYNLHNADNIPWILTKLRAIKRKYKKMSFLRFNRKGEREALSSLKKYGEKSRYLLIGAMPSTLWFTIRIADVAKCSKISIYGVPDSKYCKRNMDSTINERYWDAFSPQLCRNGIDFSSRTKDYPETLSIIDRRSLAGWATSHNVTFISPSWPQ